MNRFEGSPEMIVAAASSPLYTKYTYHNVIFLSSHKGMVKYKEIFPCANEKRCGFFSFPSSEAAL